MKKTALLFIFLYAMLCQNVNASDDSEALSIRSGSAIVIDSVAGEILYEKNKDEQAYPASLTKLMTAILLEEKMSNEEWMTASKKAVDQEASNYVFNLHVGEQMQKEEALKALIVVSANDVAMMIAEHIGGNQADFAAMMNEKALSIGMLHTHFVTPNGLHNSKHYSTAYDLALLAKEAMKYPAIMEAMGTERTAVKTDQRQVTITNRSLIFKNPFALGGKTGFTDQARNTLIEYMKKDNKTVISVVLKSSREDEYRDVEAIGQYGLDRIATQMMFHKGDYAGDATFYDETVTGILGDSYALTILRKDDAVYAYKAVFNPWLNDQQTVETGDVIGTYQIWKNGEFLKQIPIVAANPVTHKQPATPPEMSSEEEKSTTNWPFYAASGFFLIMSFGLFVWQIIRNRRKQTDSNSD
ncbi:D-alanyl-D-alanine carboxypeptidase family protein [Paenibacillus roseipurpureus]|uniref:D-alanyl-D-alanine carboxypeptidase family protein n=1 Tax=Paenibacillus roseopurpureus TaxID=2918901 RepID=A0AA96LLL5_9BACL|nr:D-alanyl-D-alanine carboxypeptidase family protein [Paenibacillus sp. MBLB1832]WNR42054.1 D-alanyl-D-alanine carboxypeptidase family protein [Paenibacillus sp. MBLB1832]